MNYEDLIKNVRFDRKNSYYEYDSTSSECLEKEEEEDEIEINEI